MKIAVTGATGFLGRHLVTELIGRGHHIVAWGRETESAAENIRWISGRLDDQQATERLIAGVDAVVHAALCRDKADFMDEPQCPAAYAQANVIGAIRLLQTSVDQGIKRFVNISSGTVHQRVLSDRPLDETHPLWPESTYGAVKASVETMVHAYGFSGKLDVCTLRPTAIYGVADPVQSSKWFELVQDVAAGKTVHATGGSKEVHVGDVARAVRILLETDRPVAGETYNCSDRMISRFEVAQLAKQLSGSRAIINGQAKVAKHAIVTTKIEGLGMQFGGTELLQATVAELIAG